jgi:hypothetical protein
MLNLVASFLLSKFARRVSGIVSRLVIPCCKLNSVGAVVTEHLGEGGGARRPRQENIAHVRAHARRAVSSLLPTPFGRYAQTSEFWRSCASTPVLFLFLAQRFNTKECILRSGERLRNAVMLRVQAREKERRCLSKAVNLR